MDRNEQNLKIEELKTAMHNSDFEKAVDIADSLDLKKIKDNNFLSLVADAYEVVHKYQEAKRVLLIAYENTNAGRQLAYRLCLITIKTKEFDEAKEFYEDFVEMAPRDTSRYILKYKMAKAQNASIEKLIRILEEYVNIDMDEKWAYELAKLYHLAGNKEKCVDMCDEISLWFANGKYVAKAMELKGLYNPNAVISTPVNENEIQEVEEDTDFSDIEIKNTSDEKFNTMDIQAVIADGMKEVEFDENTNMHEGGQATKIAPDFANSEKKSINPGEMQEITDIPETIDEIEESDVEAVTEQEEVAEPEAEVSESETETLEEVQEILPKEEEQQEATPEVEPIKDIKGVEDILRQLQERGILKAETVQQAVNIIDEAGKSSATDTQNVSTMERWEEDNTEPVEEEQEEAVPEPTGDASEEVVSEPMDNASEEPDIKEEVIAHTAEIKLDSKPVANGVPVFDLAFDAPERDTTNDIGQEAIYETTVANSDLGNITDSLPSKEEIEEAIKKAEQAMEAENAEPLKSGETEFRSDKELSVDVEILSGTDWKQNEDTKKTADNTPIVKKEEATVNKAATQNVNLGARAGIANVDLGIAKETVQTLSEEELSTFKNYLNVEGFATNIKEVLQELITNYNPNGKSTDGNVIIMGNEKTGKTTLAIETIKLVNKKRGRRNRKLVKVDAGALNRRGFRNSLNKLLGSDLIIENAHNLGAMTLSEVIDASGMFTDDMLIVLEGETEPMERMLEESPRLSAVFNHVIRIREYDIKEWVEYGKKYAKEQGYKMDELANLAFYKAIDDFFGVNKGIGQSDVETIVDDAISRSGRIRRKLSGVFSSKKDEDGLSVLVESDFNIK